MSQCLHYERDGHRCHQEAVEGENFCFEHDPEYYSSAAHWRRLGLRVAALVLLLAFVVPLLLTGWRVLLALLN
jgi:hypothetical protein